MERYELTTLIDKSESRTRLIHMALQLFHHQTKRAIEDYSQEPELFVSMVCGAMKELDTALGELT